MPSRKAILKSSNQLIIPNADMNQDYYLAPLTSSAIGPLGELWWDGSAHQMFILGKADNLSLGFIGMITTPTMNNYRFSTPLPGGFVTLNNTKRCYLIDSLDCSSPDTRYSIDTNNSSLVLDNLFLYPSNYANGYKMDLECNYAGLLSKNGEVSILVSGLMVG